MESPANTLTMLRLLNDSLDFGSPLPNAGSCEKIENRLLPALSVRRGTAVPRARATQLERALRARFHLSIWRRGGLGLAQFNLFTAPGVRREGAGAAEVAG